MYIYTVCIYIYIYVECICKSVYITIFERTDSEGRGPTHGLLLLGRSGKNINQIFQHQKSGVHYKNNKTSSHKKSGSYVCKRLLQPHSQPTSVNLCEEKIGITLHMSTPSNISCRTKATLLPLFPEVVAAETER